MEDKEKTTNSKMKWLGFGILLLLVFAFVQKHSNTSEDTITIVSPPESEEKKIALKKAVKSVTGKDLKIITIGETPPAAKEQSAKKQSGKQTTQQNLQQPITPEDTKEIHGIYLKETPLELKRRLLSYDPTLPQKLLNELQKEREKSRFKDEKDLFSQLKNTTKNKKVLGEISYQQCRNATHHYDFTEIAYKYCQNAISYDPDNARFLVAMGRWAYGSRKYQEAISNFEKALAVLTTTPDVGDTLVLDAKSSLAQALSSAGRYEEAIKLYEQCLTKRIQLSGKNHYTVARYYRVLGVTWEEAGDERKALEYLEKALDLSTRLFGERSLDVAEVYSALADTYFHFHKYQKTSDLCNQALRLYLVICAQDHKEIARLYLMLGDSLMKIDECKKALIPLRKCLSLEQHYSALEKPAKVWLHFNIARCLQELDKNQESLQHLDQATKLCSELDPKDWKDWSFLIDRGYGIAYRALGQSDTALMFFEKALVEVKKFQTSPHLDTAGVYWDLAQEYYSRADYQKAKQYYQEILTILEAIYAKDHHWTVELRGMIKRTDSLIKASQN